MLPLLQVRAIRFHVLICTILLTIRTLIGCVYLHRLDSENLNVLLEVSVSIDAYLGYASPATQVILGKS